MFGIVARVAAVAISVGFGAGILAHRKAGKVKEEIRERLATHQTEVLVVDVPKGTDLNKCRIVTKVLIPNELPEVVEAKMIG